jgi:hypothetical protein
MERWAFLTFITKPRFDISHNGNDSVAIQLQRQRPGTSLADTLLSAVRLDDLATFGTFPSGVKVMADR